MGSDPAPLTRTPVSSYGRGPCGAVTAQHYLFSLGENKGEVLINYLPAGLHPLCIVLRLFDFDNITWLIGTESSGNKCLGVVYPRLVFFFSTAQKPKGWTFSLYNVLYRNMLHTCRNTAVNITRQ